MHINVGVANNKQLCNCQTRVQVEMTSLAQAHPTCTYHYDLFAASIGGSISVDYTDAGSFLYWAR